MFVNAVESIREAIRPMHIIRRRFGDNAILPDIATLFFVNEYGYAITSKRVSGVQMHLFLFLDTQSSHGRHLYAYMCEQEVTL